MRPIDADALIEKCGDWYVEEGTESGFIGTLKNLLATEPTIQPQSTAGQLNDGAQSTDLIDRQAVIDELRKFKPEIIPYEKARIYVEETVETMYDRIVELPSIQPEQCGDKSYTLWKESYEELKRRMDELTSCSDIISRQAAIDAVNNAFDRETLLTGFVRSIAVRAIRDMPSAQPEPKEGEWVLKDHLWECNKCGCRINVKNPLCGNNLRYYFCPHCGTKMIIAVQRF